MRKALAIAAATLLAASAAYGSIPKRLPDYALMQEIPAPQPPLSKGELERAVGATHARSATCALNGYDTGLSMVPGSSGEYVLTQFNESSAQRTGIAEFLDVGFTLGEDGGVRIARRAATRSGRRTAGTRGCAIAP